MSLFSREIEDLLNNVAPIVMVEAEDEMAATKIVKNVFLDWVPMEWSVEGFKDGKEDNVARLDWSLEETLRYLLQHKEKRHSNALVLRDAHPYLFEPEIIALLKLLAQQNTYGNEVFSVVIIVPEINFPRELEGYIDIVRDHCLEVNDIQEFVNLYLEQEIDLPESVQTSDLEKTVLCLKGLNECEIRDVLNDWLLIDEDGSMRFTDIMVAKQKIIQKKAPLKLIHVDKSTEVYGQRELSEWLQIKAECFSRLNDATEYGVNMPRGVLITGIPGAGKSINAYLAAKLFKIPLIQFDFDKVIKSYHLPGRNQLISESIEIIEAMSPCILWIDDVEKMIFSNHIFSEFFEWLQRKSSQVFIVATLNEIQESSMYMIRKCKFDDIFYIGVPSMEARQKIFEKFIKDKRPSALQYIDTETLAGMTEGFCGADIEKIVNTALEKAFVSGKMELTQDDFYDTIHEFNPLNVQCIKAFEKMEKLHKNYKFKDAQ